MRRGKIERVIWLGMWGLAVLLLACRKPDPACQKLSAPLDTLRQPLEAGLTRLEVEGAVQVSVRQSSQSRLEVVGPADGIETVQITPNRNTLTLKAAPCYETATPLTAIVYLPGINSLQHNGSAVVELQGLYRSNQFDLTCLNTGNFLGQNVEFLNLSINQNGGGIIQLQGGAVSQAVTVAGPGPVFNGQLNAQTVSVNHNGTGVVEVFANASLTVTLNSTGSVFYRGNVMLPTVIQNGTGGVFRQ